jgi:glycosyltransferase involved in cell wall biosynthesis
LKVLIVAEYYPRAADSVLGIWAHRQALAARDAGAEVRVLVLHRPIPPLAALRRADVEVAASALRQPPAATLDGISIDYLRYLSPPRPWSYQSWGAWAAPRLGRALRRIRKAFPFELIHAHYAVPAADAVRRVAGDLPIVVSVHGHDVQGARAGGRNVRRALRRADLVLANSRGTAQRCLDLGARATRVVHLGTDIPSAPPPRPLRPVLTTVAHLAARKRHADVISALALLRGRHPGLRYVIVGAGPESERLRALAHSLLVDDLVEFRGQLPPPHALAAAWGSTLFVLPSVEEAFGVAYIEAMAGGVPAIGCRGEDGPEEIAAAGDGIVLVPPRDPAALAARIEALLRDPERLAALGEQARATVRREFTWEKCGRDTVAAYREVLKVRRRAGEHERS